MYLYLPKGKAIIQEKEHNSWGDDLLTDVAVLFTSLGIILLGAAFFTNAIEWLGKKLNLTEGAVGSILAAVGTAMPETLIPLTAILLGTGDAAHEIGVGAILGAPFMLGTLAMFLVGSSVFLFRKKRAESSTRIEPDPAVIRRDLGFFIVVYTLAISAAFMVYWLKIGVALLLVAAYIIFAYKTLTSGGEFGEECQMDPLYLARSCQGEPPTFIVVGQLVLAFGAIIVGANFFVHSVEDLSSLLGVPAFIMSLLIAPVATEMPEKFNSLIWLSQKKDTVALGNITGAMVFQSSVIPAVGITLTPWVLTPAAIISAILALTASISVYLFIRYKNYLDGRILMLTGGLFYSFFVVAVLKGIIR